MKHRPLPLLDIGGSDLIAHSTAGWDEIISKLGQVRLDPGEFLQMAVLGSRENLLGVLQSSSMPSSLRMLRGNQAAGLFSYASVKGERRFEGEFAAIRTRHPAIYVLMFVTPRTYWRTVLLPFVERLYPKVAQPFLTQIELHGLLGAVQKSHPLRGIRVLEFSARKKLRGEARKRFQSTREWTDESLENAFREARQANRWFQSVTFEVVRPEEDGRLSPTSRATLSKYGYLACDGDFQMYSTVVLDRLVDIAANRLDFFSKRDRISTDDNAPKPVTIEYDSDVFNAPQDTSRLSEALRRFKYGSCSVLHSNPYLHVSVVDNRDFSSAEVWVLSPRQILVVPQVRASDMALKRLVNHIFEYFREGTLSDIETAA